MGKFISKDSFISPELYRSAFKQDIQGIDNFEALVHGPVII